MKKLSLNLDTLRVDSFETVPATRAQRGTVRGYVSNADCLTEPGIQEQALLRPSLWNTIIGACPSWFICTQATACEC
jgi:hypothetical protein